MTLLEKATNKSAACPKCFGTGWERLLDGPKSGARPCECRTASRGRSLHASSRLPRRYEECTFESYFPLNSSQEAALMFARRVADEYPNLDIGLLFMGSCGVGKTHLAVSILKALLD